MNETFRNSFSGMLGIFAAFGVVLLTGLGVSKLATKITERKLKKMTKDDENPSEENKEED